MRIELFGIARARAGTEAVEVEASNLGEAVRALEAACPALVPEVIDKGRLTSGYLASLNEEGFISDETTPLDEKDTVLIVGAQAGG